MSIARNITIVLLIVLSCINTLKAQPGFYVPANGKIFFKDTATIFSNVLNYGSFGIGKDAMVNFSGKRWKNDSLAVIRDELNNVKYPGGTICFLSDTIAQQIDGGYSFANRIGPAFPTVVIKNKAGTELVGTTTKIRSALVFNEGLVFLNNNIMMLGELHPGTIEGYDSTRYIVTNYEQINGFLLRENITADDSLVVFPIGSKEGAYTPVGIRSKTARGDDYYAGVSDTVRSNLFTGADMADTTVNKTWKIGKIYYPDMDDVEIYLQHLLADEGSAFTAGRSHSYISQYTDTGWDYGSQQTIPSPGTITTGNTLNSSGINTRSIHDSISHVSYFTKFAVGIDADTVQMKISLGGVRLNDDFVSLSWQSNNDSRIDHFILQRKLSSDTGYTNIVNIHNDIVYKQKGIQNTHGYIDTNNRQDIASYRVWACKRNATVVSNTVIIEGSTNFDPFIWPNPSDGHFFIDLKGNTTIAHIVIWDVLGQSVLTQTTNSNIIEITGLNVGNYVVSFITTDNKILKARNIVVR